MSAPRIGAMEARSRVKAGQALLVCAYESDEKFQRNRIEGAISFAEFLSRQADLPADQEIIFYCA